MKRRGQEEWNEIYLVRLIVRYMVWLNWNLSQLMKCISASVLLLLLLTLGIAFRSTDATSINRIVRQNEKRSLRGRPFTQSRGNIQLKVRSRSCQNDFKILHQILI